MPMSAKTFVTSQLFSPLGKLRLMGELFIRAGNPQGEESVAAFARRRLGREGCDYLVSTFVTSVLAGDPERFSIRYALLALSQTEQRYGSLTRGFLKMARERKRQVASAGPDTRMERARAFSFRDGIQTLTDALFTHIQPCVCLNTSVVRLQRISSGWIVTTLRG